MKRWEISVLQSAELILGLVSMTGHALAVTHFMRAGGRDAWMSGILASPGAVLAFWCWYKLRLKFPGDTIVQYLPKVLGFAGYPIALFYLIYYLTVVVFSLRMTTDWMVDSILPETPAWVMGALYMAAVTYTTAGGLDVLARVNQFTLPLLMFFGMLVSVSTLPAKDYRLLTPFFEKGYLPVLATTILGLGLVGETSIISMYDTYVVRSEQKKLFKYYLVSLVFIVLTLTGPLAGAVASLGYRVAQNMPYPTYKHWLMVSYARFFERLDLLAVHQWLGGAYVRCGVYLLMVTRGFRQLGSINRVPEKPFLVAIAGVTVAVSEWAFPNKPAFDMFVMDIYLPAGMFAGVIVPVLLLTVAWARSLGKQRPGTQTHGG